MGYRPVVPILEVSSVRASIAFYVEHLGFAEKWTWSSGPGFEESSEPEFACVECDEAVLFLTVHGAGNECSLFIELPFVEDVDALAEKLRASSVSCDSPTDRPWGSREFTLEDPDGHRIRFSCPLDRRRSE